MLKNINSVKKEFSDPGASNIIIDIMDTNIDGINNNTKIIFSIIIKILILFTFFIIRLVRN